MQNKGYLILYGLNNSRYHVQPLIDAFEKKGDTVFCPVIAGHEDSNCSLKDCTWEDWLSTAENGLTSLKEKCNEVHVIGFSMGGLLGIQLANDHPINSLTTINTPVHYINPVRVIKNILSDIFSFKRNNIERYVRSRSVPWHAVSEFKKLLKTTLPKVKNVNAPAMVIQAKDDDVVKYSSGTYLYNNLIPDKKNGYFLLPKGGHVILHSDHSNTVIQAIYQFHERISAESA